MLFICCAACPLISVRAGMLDSCSSSSFIYSGFSYSEHEDSLSLRCTIMLTEAGHDPSLVEL